MQTCTLGISGLHVDRPTWGSDEDHRTCFAPNHLVARCSVPLFSQDPPAIVRTRQVLPIIPSERGSFATNNS